MKDENVETEYVNQAINLMKEMYNIESLKGDSDVIHNSKKVISCFVNPQHNWKVRTKDGLCEEANISKKELEEVLSKNKSTFMIDSYDRIILRARFLCFNNSMITHIYSLDQF